MFQVLLSKVVKIESTRSVQSGQNRSPIDRTDNPADPVSGYPVLAFFFSSFDYTAPFLKKLHSFLTFYFIDFFNIINQNNLVPMLTETFNIVGAQGNFLKFMCYFILLYVFIYFKLNELFFKKNL